MTRAVYLEAGSLHPRPVHGDHSEAHPHELEAAEAGLLPGGGVVQPPLRDADPGPVTAPEAANREKRFAKISQSKRFGAFFLISKSFRKLQLNLCLVQLFPALLTSRMLLPFQLTMRSSLNPICECLIPPLK